ncbi:MAG: UPF0182 family protein [Cyanobacteria bacterium J06635_15]
MKRTLPTISPFWIIAFAVVAGFLLSLRTLITLLTESWWFSTVGFEQIFWTRISWQIVIWLGTFAAYGILLGANYLMALRLTRDRSYTLIENTNLRPYAKHLPRYTVLIAIVVLSFVAANNGRSAWEIILKYLNPTAFAIQDPIFGLDLSFYIFQLPFYEGLQRGILGLLLWSSLIALAVYGLKGEIRPERGWKYFLTGEAKTHLCLLLAAIAVTIAVGFWLARYEILYSSSGTVFGAGYTDVHARLQSYWLMAGVTLGVAALFIISLGRSGFSLPSFGIAMYGVALLVVNVGYPWFQQQFIVAPNELEKERPYIEHNIQFTRTAYGLEQIQSEAFPADQPLSSEALARNQSTLDNIRLWDYRPLLSTYKQLQEIRLYYRFKDVDIDRYTLNGDYRQVMLAPRELAYEQVPQQAKTWVNQRLKYTHGFGLVMSPVNQVTPDGLPELFFQNVPPQTTTDLTLDQSRLYYGEETNSYIFTGTSTDEFDYPQGESNALTRYDGLGGVPMGSLWRRLVYALRTGSFKILISNYFGPESKIHYYRQVMERVRHVAPFLQLDNDPYIAVIDGRLQWIVDAYTISDRYPYSEPLFRSNNLDAILTENSSNIGRIAQQRANYVRDAVKVVVDAYDGTMRFFAIDPNDPVLATYAEIFPELFEPEEAAPAAIKAHFRYPLDFFKIQAQMYQTYHMANPEVFYNREDVWQFPSQVYEGDVVLVEPYYVIMRLPEAEVNEFMLIVPFTPVDKDNMVAWFAARSDGDAYGKQLLYEFPKQELVYGPSQIEARIDQNPEISQQLTLWSQEGSRVIRGDLLVIPIEQSLLYVEPVYLRAEQGELPELKRVIMAYGDQTVMANDLAGALTSLFGEIDTIAPDQAVPDQAVDTAPVLDSQTTQLIQQALEVYQQGQAALQEQNWQLYGETQQQLESILQQLNQTTSNILPAETPTTEN